MKITHKQDPVEAQPEARIKLAEDIINAHYDLEQAMYNSDLEISWQVEQNKVSDLEATYKEKYNIDFGTTE